MCTNLRTLRIKSVSAYGAKSIIAPCGHCEECCAAESQQWQFRLLAEQEYLVKRGWRTAFFTLTYKQKRLPWVPAVERLTGELTHFPCFDKKHIQLLFKKIRRKLYKKHLAKKNAMESRDVYLKEHPFICPKWLVAGEYGSSTHRPHYHGLIFIPPTIDARFVHKLILQYWQKNGFITPWKFEGNAEKDIKPFVCIGPKAVKYASKYICKDLAFEEHFGCYDFFYDKRELRRFKCFHLQSRSLGFSWLLDKTDADKLKAIKCGVNFAGSDKVIQLPVYLKNKILFTPKYEKCVSNLLRDQSGKPLTSRLVRREVTSFFVAHYKEIFQKKVEIYEEQIKSLGHDEYWHLFGHSRSYASRLASNCRNIVSTLGGPAQAAALYLAYYGVPFEKCTSVPCDSWFRRFDDFDVNFDKLTPITHKVYDDVTRLGYILLCFSFGRLPKKKKDDVVETLRHYLQIA